MRIPEGTVLARAAREDWTQQIQVVKHDAKATHSNAITPMQSAAISMQQRGERHIGRMAGITERGVDHVEAMDGGGILDRIDAVEKLDKVARRTFGITEGDAHGNNVMVNIALLSIAPTPAEIEPSGD